jgi:replication-associated recombination protein RarA
MKGLGYGKDHVRYAWKEEKDGKIVDQEYLPDSLRGKKYFRKDW